MISPSIEQLLLQQVDILGPQLLQRVSPVFYRLVPVKFHGYGGRRGERAHETEVFLNIFPIM